MIEIELTQGQKTIVDDCDSDLSDVKWCAHYNIFVKSFYAQRIDTVNSVRITRHIHREILSRILFRPLLTHEHVDHVNRNPLDNRRENLRLATRNQNMQNRGIKSNNTSGFIGVQRHSLNRWRADIRSDKRIYYLGLFESAEEAAKIYDYAALDLHREFAVLNFPQ